MFTETVTATDGTTETGTATEAHALATLRRAVGRRGVTIEATRTGGVIIEREIWDGGVIPKRRTIVFEPAVPVGNITARMREDLDAIDGRAGAYLVTKAEPEFRVNVGRIAAGLWGVAPGGTKRLIDRGLVGVGAEYSATSNGFLPETRAAVRVSLAARLAMFAAGHRTRTSSPAGYVRPADIGMEGAVGLNKPGKRAGMVYDRRSPSSCTCRGWTYHGVDGPEDARRRARQHRQEVTAAFVRTLP
ncbi:hypothetical protein ACGF3G_00590 [Streptomyces sp. NPDC048179]|uniref:hypothetical protein n=1 Tax=Streptomyces sp. NPDC048179 TaxID=3365506 RepID=UPI00371FBF57